MAKITKKYSFSKAEISYEEDGKYTITEIGKDDSTDYNLSSVLDSFVGLSGVSLSIGIDDEVPSVEET
mgnify:CR=1 FL=1